MFNLVSDFLAINQSIENWNVYQYTCMAAILLMMILAIYMLDIIKGLFSYVLNIFRR